MEAWHIQSAQFQRLPSPLPADLIEVLEVVESHKTFVPYPKHQFNRELGPTSHVRCWTLFELYADVARSEFSVTSPC